MSRFEQDIEVGLRQIADRATPSPDAWNSILNRIADQEPIHETEIIMLTDSTIRTRRWPQFAAAAAVAALLVGGIVLIARDGPEAPVVPPSPTTSVVEPEPEAVTGALPEAGTQVTPGRYSSDALGVPVAFDVQQGTAGPFTVLSQQPGAIELQVENGPAVEYVGIWRIGSFYNTTEANDPTTTGLGSIAADDIDGWIESNAMTVAESAEVSIGGRSAKLRRVILDSLPTGNGWGWSRSADLASGPEPVDIFAGEWINSVWIVDMDDFEPIMIFAATDGADQQQWIDDIAQPIVDSMVFGDPAPTVEGGTARLSTFGDQVGGILALAPQGEPAPPGSYTSDAFGVPTTFEIPDVASSPWTVGVNNEEAIVLAHGENTFVAIKRVGSFYDADQAVDPSIRGLGSIPPDGVDEWIEANGLIVDESAEVTVGGRIAQFRQLRLPAGVGGELCQDGIPSPCLNMISSSADQQGFEPFPTIVATEVPSSFWFVDMGEFEPLGIWASTTYQDHQTWLDELAPLIASIEFGELGPAVEGGTARVPLRMTVDTAWSGTRVDGDTDADGVTPISGQLDSTGGVTGEATLTGERRIIPPNGDVAGTADYVFAGTIDGVGTGTFSFSDEWSKINGNFSFTGDPIQITNGTGDFEGMTGTIEIVIETSTSEGPTETIRGTMTITITLPRSG